MTLLCSLYVFIMRCERQETKNYKYFDIIIKMYISQVVRIFLLKQLCTVPQHLEKAMF